ncbi:MAG: hypothetical protein IBX61_07945 [Thermoleophilia bacterium]|nr:hypothetical protein [Thermoleophilia bacterium]
MRADWLKKCTIIAVIVLTTVVLAAGCGDEDGDGAGEETPGPVAGADSVDACSIVTQQDASDLFGDTASSEASASLIADPNMIGECLWSADTETSSQLLQFRVWDGEMYYAPTEDSQPFELGEKGAIRVHSIAGVDIEWVQDGKTVNLSYFTTGEDVPDAVSKEEEVKDLARKAAEKL